MSEAQDPELEQSKKFTQQAMILAISSRYKQKQNEVNSLKPITGKSIYLFSDTNKFRSLVFKVVESSRFDYFILLMIAFQSVLLVLENPLNDPEGSL